MARSRVRDRRFRCPDCSRPIRIVIASANSLSDQPDTLAVCIRCCRFYQKEEWQIIRNPGPMYPEEPDLNALDF